MSSSQFMTHIAASGDRWDLLSWRYYGDPSMYGAIIVANPTVPIDPVISAGQIILIPVLERVVTLKEPLPPWKRGEGQGA